MLARWQRFIDQEGVRLSLFLAPLALPTVSAYTTEQTKVQERILQNTDSVNGQVTAQVGGDTAAPAQPHDPQGLFGTTVSFGEDLLVIEAKSGTVNVPISE
jgi:hypothetical protein